MRKALPVVFHAIIRWAALLVCLGVLAAFSARVGHSQGENSEYFDATRHSVQGAFLEAYRAAANPELVYGYPITEEFVNAGGVLVQYFQRARFELTAAGRVVRTPVGALMYAPGRPEAGIDANPATCRTFGGIPVCMAFLEFFEAHGGEAQFGLPISGVEKDGPRHVQYFEYARLEWHPESGDPGLEVRLGDLGRLLFHRLGEDARLLDAVDTQAIVQLTSLRIHAFPAASSAAAGGEQAIYVVVQDQAFQPVAGAGVRVAVTYPSERQDVYQGVTNAFGYAAFTLALGQEGTGLATVTAETTSFNELDVSTRTSFRLFP